MSNNSPPFDYIKNHHEVPQLPDDNSRYKWIKNFISRCIAHFTSAQNTFNNNVADALIDINNNLNSITKKQDSFSKKIDDFFIALDNRQNDIVKSMEILARGNEFLKQKQEEIEKFVQSTFSDVDNRQNSLIENIESTNQEMKELTNRQNDIIKKVSEQIKNIDNRQNDIVKSFETLTGTNDFLKQKQEEIEKFVQSTFSDVDNRQNSLIENIESTNQKMNKLNNRQNDIVKSFESLNKEQQEITKKQINIQKFTATKTEELDNRQNDLVKSIENLDREQRSASKGQIATQEFAATKAEELNNRQNDLVNSLEKANKEFKFFIKKQNEIKEYSNSKIKELDNRQNDLVKSLHETNKNISGMLKRMEKVDGSFKNSNSLYERIAEQNKLIKNIISTAINSPNKKLKSNSKDILNDLFNDSLYLDYEQMFRGSEKIIKKRLTYYIDILKNVKTSEKKYVLDVGCGRGEFVSLLIENKFHAKGVDTNSVAVQHAINNKLPVKKDDLFNVLKKCKDNSLPVISAFHVIEHLQHNDLLSFFRITINKLQPDGKLLLETPNMLSLFVAACDFYKDPTHIRPLHPATLQFYLKEAGFKKVEVDFLHPFPESEQLKILKNSTAANDNFIKLNDLIFGARDCAIIAKK